MILWLQVVGSTASWTALYFIIKHLWRFEPEPTSRIVAAIHGLAATIFSGIALATGPWPFTDPGGPNTPQQLATLSVCLGYFIYDLGWCLCHQTEGVTMLAHHMISIVAITRVMMKGFSGAEASAGAGGLECTNPLLQLRWFIRKAGYKEHLIYKVVELTFMVMFVIMRIIAGSFLLFSVLTHKRPDIEARILAIALYVISWIFMVSIADHFYKNYVKPLKKIQKD